MRRRIFRKPFATCRFPIVVPQAVDGEEAEDAGQVVVEGAFGFGVVLIGFQPFDENEKGVLNEVVRFEGREVPRGVIAQSGRVLVEELGPPRGAGSASDCREQLAGSDGEWVIQFQNVSVSVQHFAHFIHHLPVGNALAFGELAAGDFDVP